MPVHWAINPRVEDGYKGRERVAKRLVSGASWISSELVHRRIILDISARHTHMYSTGIFWLPLTAMRRSHWLADCAAVFARSLQFVTSWHGRTVATTPYINSCLSENFLPKIQIVERKIPILGESRGKIEILINHILCVGNLQLSFCPSKPFWPTKPLHSAASTSEGLDCTWQGRAHEAPRTPFGHIWALIWSGVRGNIARTAL